jgi:hypothetical protein
LSWRDRTVIRILLFVAVFVSEESIRKELQGLANHINLYAPKKEGEAQ